MMTPIPLISFFHPERLWLLLVVPVLFLAYFALLRRSTSRTSPKWQRLSQGVMLLLPQSFR